MKKLLDFASDKYSQNGEDGIIKQIFEIISPLSQQSDSEKRVCIEFGAWDGFHLSNTANLWTNGWKGILIEADKIKFEDLKKNVKDYDCICINEYVSFPPTNTLEKILQKHDVKDKIDFLSIDIDGADYYVFESLNKLRPKVICCEYNPSIPYHISLIGQRQEKFGCSALALSNLAEKKGYKLVAITSCNCFFVAKEYFEKFNMYETSLDQLQLDFVRKLNYVITSFEGKYVLAGTFANGLKAPYKGKLIGHNVYRVKSLKGFIMYKINPYVAFIWKLLKR